MNMNDFEKELITVLRRIADAKEKSVKISEKNLEQVERSIESNIKYQEKAIELDEKKNNVADNLEESLLNSLFEFEEGNEEA